MVLTVLGTVQRASHISQWEPLSYVKVDGTVYHQGHPLSSPDRKLRCTAAKQLVQVSLLAKWQR